MAGAEGLYHQLLFLKAGMHEGTIFLSVALVCLRLGTLSSLTEDV